MDKKIMQAVLSGKQDRNVRFDDLRKLLLQLGFNERIIGGHFIYKKHRIPERVNIQPDGSKAKAYQVRQIRGIINKYGLEEYND